MNGSIAMSGSERRRALLFGIGFEGGLGIVALGLGWLLDQHVLGWIEWNLRDMSYGVLATLPLVLLFVLSERWPIGALRGIGEILDEILVPFLGKCTIGDLALISLLAGLGEEMLFRGVLQAVLSQWLGHWLWGLILASILFGLAHLITPMYAIVVTLIGLYLGWLWHATGNLMTPILTHALYDFFALVFWLRFRSQPEPTEDHAVRSDRMDSE